MLQIEFSKPLDETTDFRGVYGLAIQKLQYFPKVALEVAPQMRLLLPKL